MLIQPGYLGYMGGGAQGQPSFSIPADFAYSPVGVTNGAYLADTLSPTGATNAAGSVTSNTNWTTASTKYFGASAANSWALVSKGSWRDQEITTWTRLGQIFMRLTPAGKAIIFDFNSNTTNGTLSIGIVTGVTDTGAPATTTYMYVNSNMTASFPTWKKTATDGQTLTFGVSGFDIYMKIDGVEVLRFQSFHHVAVGRMGLKSANTTTGFRATTGTFLPLAGLYSSLDRNGSGTFDLRDLGLKELSTTGSITAASTTLTVADSTGFEVGDYIAIPVGYEAGAGIRGTKGVGGTWPALSYANAAARTADTTQVNNKYAWQEDTGVVYRWATGSPGSWTAQTSYYIAKALPRGLRARITAIAGNDITLDTAATVTATNAPVYFDNSTVMAYIGQVYGNVGSSNLTTHRPSTMRIKVPAGTYYGTGPVYLPDSNIVGFQGDTKETTILRSVPGHNPLAIFANNGGTPTVSDFTLYQLMGDDGFGLDWAVANRVNGWSASGLPNYEATTGNVTETAVTSGSGYPPGILFSSITNGIMRNIKVVDALQKSFGTNFCTDTWAYDVEVIQNHELRQYVQWQVQWSDCTRGGVDGCVIDCYALNSTFEVFKGTGVVFSNFTVRNGSGSVNGSELWTYQNMDITLDAGSLTAASTGFANTNPGININNNIGAGAGAVDGGGIIEDVTFTQDYLNAANDLLTPISIGGSNPNIIVRRCTSTAPDFIFGCQVNYCHFSSDGANTDLSDFTTSGKSQYNVLGGGALKSIRFANNSTAASGSTYTNVTTSPVANDVQSV